MSNSTSDSVPAPPSEPSQITGQLKSAQGQLYEAIGAVSSDPSWKTQGAQLREEGQEELQQAKTKAQAEAGVDKLWGKAESAYGFVTGNQETAKEGNMRAEKAEWKSAAAEGSLPSVSLERMAGKAESAIGMATGDIEKQKQGNIRAEKAEWTGK